MGANRPGVCTRVSARHYPAAACGDWPVRSECAGTLCCTPGLPSRLACSCPLPRGSSFVVGPPTQRSIIPNILPLYIVRAPRTPCLPAPPAWAPLGNRTPIFSTKYPPCQGSVLPVSAGFLRKGTEKSRLSRKYTSCWGENCRKSREEEQRFGVCQGSVLPVGQK